jgi:hypothetical protein
VPKTVDADRYCWISPTDRPAGRVHWDRCQPFFVRGHTGSSSARRTQEDPPHVHVEREEGKAKFWLEPVRLESSRGFGRVEIGRIQRLVEENTEVLLRSWHEYFGE